MYIGELAKKTGLSPRAIRLYEDKGLLNPPVRKGRYRVYREIDIDILNLIVEAKALGMSLAQLGEAITYQNGEVDWQRVHTVLQEFKRTLEKELVELNKRIAGVKQCISEINSCPRA